MMVSYRSYHHIYHYRDYHTLIVGIICMMVIDDEGEFFFNQDEVERGAAAANDDDDDDDYDGEGITIATTINITIASMGMMMCNR